MVLSLRHFDFSVSLRSSGFQQTIPAMHGIATNAIEVDIVRGDRSVISRHAAEWTELCLEGPCSLPFLTPNWIATWLETFAPSAKVVLVLAKRDGELRGV